jgi:phosphoribosyl-dephospho-CoA transferase
MLCDPRPHALLRIADADDLEADTPPPVWVAEQLRQAPWVVVRRARLHAALIPVGVRGRDRSERFAAWLRASAVQQCETPQGLAAQRGWREHPRRDEVGALAALDWIETVMRSHNLGSYWGPAGSVAFELATGIAATHAASDVDLVIQMDAAPKADLAATLLAELAPLPARVDVLIEMPHGAVALADCARRRAPYLLRTPDGPSLRDHLRPEAGAP